MKPVDIRPVVYYTCSIRMGKSTLKHVIDVQACNINSN